MDEIIDSPELSESANPIGAQQLHEFNVELAKYKAGKASVDRRIISAENWWKLRNQMEAEKQTAGKEGFQCKSGWMHNVIVSKHADSMEAFPEPIILPREERDKDEAQRLTSIIPCVLEQNNFEETYDRCMWQKLKTGTGAYKVYWDSSRHNGLGDIAISRVDLLNLFWQPGITDIQESQKVFYATLRNNEELEALHPELKGHSYGLGFQPSKLLHDDSVTNENQSYVIECFYHKFNKSGQKILHYVQYVGDHVLYATENDTEPGIDGGPSMAERGIYDHGLFPFVLDTLFPIEGSPCGYGYIDLCQNQQISIDLMRTAFLKNTLAGAMPRYFKKKNSNIDNAQLLDLNNALVEVEGGMDEASLRIIPTNNLDGNYLAMLNSTIDEMRETSGNTEAASGSAPAGVTAASAIAALQEASGKGSRDSSRAAYRAYNKIIALCIELIRQFYDVNRQFRITGEFGEEEFVSYANDRIKPQHQGVDYGIDMGYRTPFFDIKVKAQKHNAYTKLSQNELALQFLKLGFFAPQMADQAIDCLSMMDFEGKAELTQKIRGRSQMQRELDTYKQAAISLAAKHDPQLYAMMIQGESLAPGPAAPPAATGDKVKLQEESRESAGVEKARKISNESYQPEV